MRPALGHGPAAGSAWGDGWPVAFPSIAQAVRWLHEQRVIRLTSDSRQLAPGDGFIAWPGANTDAREFLPQAFAAGAVAALIEADGAQQYAKGLTDPSGKAAAEQAVASLPDLKARAGVLADQFLGSPSRRMDVLAVTGTNGKTSTTWWIAQALQACGRRCGVAGTLGVGLLPDLASTGLTTPDALSLHHSFAQMLEQGVDACAIEASSIGMEEGRLNGTHIAVALFSNLTQDHLDYHGDMPTYWAAKRKLFDWQGLRAAVVNVDDAHGAALALELALRASAGSLSLWTVSSTTQSARLSARDVVHSPSGLRFDVTEQHAEAACAAGVGSAVGSPVGIRNSVQVRTPLVGGFNVDNLLLVLAGLRELGIPLADAAAALAHLEPVPGRLQRVQSVGKGLPDVVVDYAHTPDALEKVLASLRPWAAQRGGALWCVVGCGGDRDTRKRPLMAAAGAKLADRLVLTSDNPRSEDPKAILRQMASGLDAQELQRAQIEPDRRCAIALAIRNAAPADVVLLAGKGHEDYQEIAGQRLPFSDTHEALLQLRKRAEGQPA